MTGGAAHSENDEASGFLLVHFVEDHRGHGERVYFSLSDGDPTRWARLNDGDPVLESLLGTTGVRDPFLVEGDDEYFIIATDLRVYGGDRQGWDVWKRHGSRSLIVWRSTDLTQWSEPWMLEVVGPEAGMAWAPEAVYDAQRREFFVFWASTLFGEDDPDHAGDTYSRILGAWTPDFRSIRDPRVLIDYGRDVIDTTMQIHDGQVHRISKEDSGLADSRRVFHEVGSALEADDFTLVEARIADEAHSQIEGPLLFLDQGHGTWYLFVDQFAHRPQGYIALTTRDLHDGWTLLPADQFHMPPNTKHGSVLAVTRSQADRLRAAF